MTNYSKVAEGMGEPGIGEPKPKTPEELNEDPNKILNPDILKEMGAPEADEKPKDKNALSRLAMGEKVNSSEVRGKGYVIDVDVYEEPSGKFTVYFNDKLERSGFSTLAEAASWGRRKASDTLYNL